MGRVSNAADAFFVAIDPPRGLRRISSDLGRMVELDPKVRAAIALLDDRLHAVPPDGQEMLGAVLWTRGRIRLACSVGLDGFRRWVGDGDAVLRAVERSLETIFSLEVLEEVIREATELAAADSGPGAEIQRARDEMQRFAAADSLVVLTGLAVVGALYLEAVIVEGYELHPPAPPPAPHTPSPGVRPEHPIH